MANKTMPGPATSGHNAKSAASNSDTIFYPTFYNDAYQEPTETHDGRGVIWQHCMGAIATGGAGRPPGHPPIFAATASDDTPPPHPSAALLHFDLSDVRWSLVLRVGTAIGLIASVIATVATR